MTDFMVILQKLEYVMSIPPRLSVPGLRISMRPLSTRRFVSNVHCDGTVRTRKCLDDRNTRGHHCIPN